MQGSVEGIDPTDADTKEPPILLALALFRRQDHIGHSVTMWQDLAKSAATPPNVRVFAEMCVVILQIIAQACSVERVNKGHGLVHSKARASIGNANTKKALFVFTNGELISKLDRDATDPKRFASFESPFWAATWMILRHKAFSGDSMRPQSPPTSTSPPRAVRSGAMLNRNRRLGVRVLGIKRRLCHQRRPTPTPMRMRKWQKRAT